MDLTKAYQHFRSWQLEPHEFKCKSKGINTCANCGHSFEGDYCPVCGQKYNIGRPDWKTVDKELMGIWSVKSSNTFLTYLMHILGRPGYLISDFLRGRREACDSPVGRLALVTVVVMVVLRLTGYTHTGTELLSGVDSVFWAKFFEWALSNVEWVVLIQTVLLIIPTWILFRFAPRHTRHTLPEGIFIQFFMSSVVLIAVMLRALLGNVMLVLIPIYYCIAYRQLFGYGLWGTVWRTLLCFGIIFYFFGTAMAVSMRISGDFWGGHSTLEFLSMFGAFLLLGAGIMFLGYHIGKRTGA